jgi:hypothetical protein
MGFLRRQVITAALTANAIRPLPGIRAGVPSFFAGWLTGELAPHLLALTVADAATHTPKRRRSPAGLMLAAASGAGLAFLIKQSRDVQERAEASLAEGLGVDYLDQLETQPTPADLATPWRRLVNPFRMREPRVRVEKNIAYNDHGRRGVLDIYRPADTPLEGAERFASGMADSLASGELGELAVTSASEPEGGAATALEEIVGLIDGGIMPRGASYSVMEQQMNRGNLAMMISGPWAWSNLRRSGIDFGVAPVPGINGNPGRPFVGTLAAFFNRHGQRERAEYQARHHDAELGMARN